MDNKDFQDIDLAPDIQQEIDPEDLEQTIVEESKE